VVVGLSGSIGKTPKNSGARRLEHREESTASNWIACEEALGVLELGEVKAGHPRSLDAVEDPSPSRTDHVTASPIDHQPHQPLLGFGRAYCVLLGVNSDQVSLEWNE
jgi:hypothetical protein